MANTLSVMTNVLRNVVSKQRIRYKENGFNLDLAYICDNIIAMGYPADNIEKFYRNRLEDVYKFLEENHPDHYKIYNLCLERSYNKNKFHGRVSVYAFEDHNPPTIELIQKFCLDVDTWLKADDHNVAAVHCKAGKGRTGTMICCYLLYSGQQGTAEDALSCYDEKRTKNRKGVTIPSQRRYVQYFSKLIRSGMPYERRSLQLRQIRFIEANLLHSQGTMQCSVSVLQDTSSTFEVQLLQSLVIDFRKTFVLDIKNVLSVAGDIKIELTHKTPRKKIFHFWFNTFFVNDEAVVEGEGDEAKLVYTFSKWEIDDVHKDKEHKCLSKDFMVALVFSTESSAVANVSNGNSSIKNKSSSGNSSADGTQCPLPENNSSGSDLNFICDQKSSSSSASVNSMGFTSTENAGPSKCHNTGMRRLIGGSAPDHPPSPFPISSPAGHFDESSSCFGIGIGEPENQAYNMYALPSLAPATHHPQTILQQQQQRQSGAPSGTPKQQQQNNFNNALASTPIGGPAYAINLRQPKMNYQPSANIKPNISRVGRETHSNSNSNNNNSRGSSSNTNNHNNNNNVQLSHASTAAAAAAAAAAATTTNSSNSSKNSSISSHSSASTNIGDHDEDDDGEEEDWESGESQAKPFVRNALVLSPMTMTSPSTLHTSIISASNLHTNDYLNLVSSTSSSSGFNDLNIGGDDINDDDDDDCNDNHDDAKDDDKVKIANSTVTTTVTTKDINKSPPTNVDLVDFCSRPKNSINCDKQNVTTIPEQKNEQTQQQHLQQHDTFFAFQPPTNSLVSCRRPSVKSKPKMLCSDLSAKSSKCAKGDSVAATCSESASGISSGGLAAASKQKLKIKLKSNKLKQKFEWFHSYFRSDPIDFCENFVQQTTAMRRNSNCSASSHSKATATPNSTPSATPITVQSQQPHAANTLRLPTKSVDNSSSTAPKTTAHHPEDGSDDYYSAICDKQLSFNNSPCKSPRTMASNGETHRRANRLTAATPTPTTFVNYREGSNDSSAERTAPQNVVVVAAKPKLIGFNIGVEPPTMLLDKCCIQEDSCETVHPEELQTVENVTRTTDVSLSVSVLTQGKPKPCDLVAYVKSCQNEGLGPSAAAATTLCSLDVTSANSNDSSSSGILTSSDCCTHNCESSCNCANPFRFAVLEQQMTNASESVVVVDGGGGNDPRQVEPISSSLWAREAGPCEQVVAVTLKDSIVE